MTSGIFQHQYQEERGTVPAETSQFIYEVIRVKKGHPLFLQEHLDRLSQSHRLVYEGELPEREAICQDCFQLIEQEAISNQNIRIEVFYQPEFQVGVFAVASSYPSSEMVKEGVRLITINATREDPHAKVDPRAFRKNILIEMKKRDAFEAALVDQEGKLTEGTRSNLFFVSGDTVYTSPGEKVLLGITRMMVVKACDSLGISVREEGISAKELGKVDAAFMTGTSVDVLPISYLDQDHLDSASHPIVKRIRDTYLSLCKDDMERVSKPCADDSN